MRVILEVENGWCTKTPSPQPSPGIPGEGAGTILATVERYTHHISNETLRLTAGYLLAMMPVLLAQWNGRKIRLFSARTGWNSKTDLGPASYPTPRLR
jgi:hypothetical protein